MSWVSVRGRVDSCRVNVKGPYLGPSFVWSIISMPSISFRLSGEDVVIDCVVQGPLDLLLDLLYGGVDVGWCVLTCYGLCIGSGSLWIV